MQQSRQVKTWKAWNSKCVVYFSKFWNVAFLGEGDCSFPNSPSFWSCWWTSILGVIVWGGNNTSKLPFFVTLPAWNPDELFGAPFSCASVEQRESMAYSSSFFNVVTSHSGAYGDPPLGFLWHVRSPRYDSPKLSSCIGFAWPSTDLNPCCSPKPHLNPTHYQIDHTILSGDIGTCLKHLHVTQADM